MKFILEYIPKASYESVYSDNWRLHHLFDGSTAEPDELVTKTKLENGDEMYDVCFEVEEAEKKFDASAECTKTAFSRGYDLILDYLDDEELEKS